jgi:hypothetical protein
MIIRFGRNDIIDTKKVPQEEPEQEPEEENPDQGAM